MARVRRSTVGLLILLLWTIDAQAQSYRASVREPAELRAGPGFTYLVVGTLARGERVRVIGRNRVGHWLQVRSNAASGARIGWLPINKLRLPDDLRMSRLAIRDLPDADLQQIEDALESELHAVSILPTISQKMCNHYNAGTIWGDRQAARVTKIGDSNSVSPAYLTPIARQAYDLGPYDVLSAAVEFFGPSMGEPSIAAQVGFNSAAAFDPFWVNNRACRPNEAPLDCELRLSQASIALVMFGINDTQVFNRADYENQMRAVIETILQARALPVLIAFSSTPSFAQRRQVIHFNLISARLAREYDVPFINFWAAAQGLNNAGMSSDGIHLASNLRFVLGGPEARLGMTLHNLLVLTTLAELRATCSGS
ncbi:MAG: GDSL-type esterase/lipase family protein [Anaerolineae bacterium]|nr:GDSL-type esterase/lipase family protein [Anaerolineae bacterium]MDW8172034.1 GDSL-type esterase/lipase family protein [Anaerolineae bacterium]